MPLPAIWSITAPICAACSRCSAMPTSRRRRSIPMSRASGCAAWSRVRTRWHGASDAAFSRFRTADSRLNIAEEVARLENRAQALLLRTYSRLTPWQKVQVARHPERPHCLDYIAGLIADFVPLAGDRAFGEDAAVVGGIGRFRGRSVVVIGTEKGADTEARVKRNFGMARPEGYRKARRLMRLAEHFGLPVVSFVDTAGAYPGIDAEARGQSEAIARAIETCLDIKVPLVAAIVGEGGS